MSQIMDRRGFLLTLPGVAFLPSLITRPDRRAIRIAGFNHAELAVSDLSRSLAFYQEVFGAPIQARREGAVVLRLGAGPQYLALRQVGGAEAPSISRVGLAVADYDPETIVRDLRAAGLSDAGMSRPADIRMRVWREPGGLFMGDAHGILVHLVHPAHCGGSGPLGNQCGPLEPAPTSGEISLLDLNHFTIGVSDPDVANGFYQDVFGLPIQAYQASSPTLDVDGGPQFLMFIGGGGGGGVTASGAVNHVCFTIQGFDVEGTFATLARHGIAQREPGGSRGPMQSYVTMRMPNRGGAEGGTPEFYFTDPDGLLIQLQDSTYCGGAGYLGDVC